MTNRSKASGTLGENLVLAKVQEIWPEAHRTSSGSPANDITGTPLQAIECKRRKQWMVAFWSFEQKKRNRTRWAIFAMDSDRRRKTAPPNVVVFPDEFALELLACWAEHGDTSAAAPPPKTSEENGGIDPEFGIQPPLRFLPVGMP